VKISEERVGDVLILKLEGNFFGSTESMAVHSKAKEFASAGNRRMIVDLAGVELMNSIGLGAIVSALISMRNAGGDLRLSGVRGKIEKLFLGASLMGLFQRYATTEEAVQSFQS
jgi:anti-sigma B factor antagonist